MGTKAQNPANQPDMERIAKHCKGSFLLIVKAPRYLFDDEMSIRGVRSFITYPK